MLTALLWPLSLPFRAAVALRRLLYHRGILRATWHATTLFGFAIAATLLHYAGAAESMPLVIRLAIVLALAGSAVAVLWWTKGRHPGWVGLAVAIRSDITTGAFPRVTMSG